MCTPPSPPPKHARCLPIRLLPLLPAFPPYFWALPYCWFCFHLLTMSWEENCYDVWNPSACTLAWVPGRQKRSTTRDIIVLTRSTDRKTPTLSTARKIDYQKALQEDHTGTQGLQQLAITNTTIQQYYHNTNTTEQQTTTTTTTLGATITQHDGSRTPATTVASL